MVGDERRLPQEEPMIEPDGVFALMMDALDGELADDGWAELEAHLRARPDLNREWRAWKAVDTLFQTAPVFMPAADFTQRTLARLPHSRQRLGVIVALYLFVLLLGVGPIALTAWLANSVVPWLMRPAITRSVSLFFGEVARLVQVVWGAFIGSLGELVAEQPHVLGYFFLMIGVILLWGGVYRQLTSPNGGLSLMGPASSAAN